MTIIKSFAVGNGDTFYIKHASDNFTIIDCDLNEENADEILKELKAESAYKGITRFISTHPDDDHFGGIELLDAEIPIRNFYVVRNKVIKDDETTSFKHYSKLRDDSEKAFYIYKGCSRRWMNRKSDERGSAGINILWPDTSNEHFKEALANGEAGISYNNMSAVFRYNMVGGASFLWLGDLETEFMEKITDSIKLEKTTVVFAAHHGRKSGKIPDAWLEKLDPQIIVIGEAPSRHLHYYTGYKIITQNRAGDITFDIEDDKVHIYASNPNYSHKDLADEKQDKFTGYAGSITVETVYTLEPAK
ncbi:MULTISPECIES: ComEC/Rec2 family competence protein [unclassified Bradyrhizobium]